MATHLDICNLALDIISVTNKVANLDAPTTKEEFACARWYTNTRDLVLRQFPWPFALTTSELVSTDDTETDLQWPFLYDVPLYWLKSRRIFVEGQARNRTPRLPFSTFLNAQGTKYIIGADTEGVSLEYWRRFDDNPMAMLFPPQFVDALAAKLAARLVKPLSLDAGLIKEAEEMYRMLAAGAFAESLEELQFDERPDPDWITARE